MAFDKGRGVITVRLYANLALLSARGTDSLAGPTEFQVEARPGLKVKDVLAERGVPLEQVSVIILDGVLAGLDASLAEGDEVGIFPALSGG